MPKDFSDLETQQDYYINTKDVQTEKLYEYEKTSNTTYNLCATFNKELNKNDFKITDNGWHWDKKNMAYFYFVFDNQPLPETKEQIGPPTKLSFHADKFRKKYKKITIRKKRMIAIIRREFRKPEDILKFLIMSDYLKDKLKKIKIVK